MPITPNTSGFKRSVLAEQTHTQAGSDKQSRAKILQLLRLVLVPASQ